MMSFIIKPKPSDAFAVDSFIDLLVQLPEKLLQSLQNIKGFDEKEFVKTHQSDEQITSIRFNPSKCLSMVNGEWSNIIQHSPFTIHDNIPWSSHGYHLSERPSFTFDPLFHAGSYYVQEASSMFLEQVLKQTTDLSKPLRILDLCAAPGGKSTLLQSLISKESLLVSNEVIKSRVHVLTENLIKWGTGNVIVTNNDPKDFARLENYFDVIIIDAPCSGSGLFRRDHDAINEWSEENVNLCCHRQQRILADAWPSLKQDGILIYSTCSYSKEENEDILDWMMDGFKVEGLRLKVEDTWGIVETISDNFNGYGYRFYPDKVKGEGFFITAMQKKDGGEFSLPKIKKPNFEKLTKNEEPIAREWLKSDAYITLIKRENLVYALPSNSLNDFNFLQSSLYVKKAGVLLGKMTAHELIPEHEFALSNIINTKINSVELSKEQAINYLRKEEMKLETDLKGWAVPKYENKNLGWMKILQNRINNYYPSAWRILKRDDQKRL
jgi:16S rRNA C967 or C1407 C5-methylase (RsmB/RsmF family)/NOL1/NOP2/fmu family ribosome biogenesis protein